MNGFKESDEVKFVPTHISNTVLCGITISADAISPTCDGVFRCLEAVREKSNNRDIAKIRILINNTTAVNVLVELKTEKDVWYYRYLRYLTRNRASVDVAFEEVTIMSAAYSTIYVLADSFTILDAIHNAIPKTLDTEYFSNEAVIFDDNIPVL